MSMNDVIKEELVHSPSGTTDGGMSMTNGRTQGPEGLINNHRPLHTVPDYWPTVTSPNTAGLLHYSASTFNDGKNSLLG